MKHFRVRKASRILITKGSPISVDIDLSLDLAPPPCPPSIADTKRMPRAAMTDGWVAAIRMRFVIKILLSVIELL